MNFMQKNSTGFNEHLGNEATITKEVVLKNMQNLNTPSYAVGSLVDQYRSMLAEYAIYCKEEEFERWQDMCKGLVDSALHMSDSEWLYEAWTVEATAQLMQAMGEGNDWNKVNEIFLKQGHTFDSMLEVSQLLIAYSPDGLSFVDNIVKPMDSYEKMTGLKNAYRGEQLRRVRQERRQRKELGGQLVKCLNTRILALSEKN